MKVDILPALMQCFAIIFIGYLIARFNVITSSQGRGISLFILYVLLPALIFKSLVEVAFPTINWKLCGGILLGKTIIFVIVVVATVILIEEGKFGKAGLYAIFATQSNDFAFGIPILTSTFYTPENKFLLDYIYILAPINLVFLNYIGFSMMEYEKSFGDSDNEENSSNKNRTSKRKLFLSVSLTTLEGIVKNPLIIATFFGIVFNYILEQNIPRFLSPFVTTLSSAYGATALFHLGWSLGNSATRVKGVDLISPLVLVTMKVIILPIVMKAAVTLLANLPPQKSGLLTTNQLAAFGFIYGALPSAPGVLAYATRYGLPEETIANGLVFGTIACAPILLASVQMMKMPIVENLDKFWLFVSELSQAVSIATVIFTIPVLVVMIMLRFHKRYPHQNTIILVIFQLSVGLMGGLYPLYLESKREEVQKCCSFLLTFAVFGQCCWTAVLAFSWALFSVRNKKLQYGIYALGILIPLLLSIIKLVITSKMALPSSPYLYLVWCNHSMDAGVIFIMLNLFVLLSIIICLIEMNKSEVFIEVVKRNKESENKPLLYGSKDDSMDYEAYKKSSVNEEYNVNSVPFLRKHNSSSESSITSENCEKGLEEYLSYNTNHIIFLLLLGFVSIVNLALALWYLAMQKTIGGLYLELLMFAVVLTFGQGFISFMSFGFVREFCLSPIFDRFQLGFRCSKCTKLKCKKDETIES